jgi:hypothetical protein
MATELSSAAWIIGQRNRFPQLCCAPDTRLAGTIGPVAGGMTGIGSVKPRHHGTVSAATLPMTAELLSIPKHNARYGAVFG